MDIKPTPEYRLWLKLTIANAEHKGRIEALNEMKDLINEKMDLEIEGKYDLYILDRLEHGWPMAQIQKHVSETRKKEEEMNS